MPEPSKRRAKRTPSQKVAAAIREAIESGELAPGDQLKAIPALADEHRVAVGTAQNAIRELEKQGYVVAIPSTGTFVADQPPGRDAATMSPTELLRQQFAMILDRLDQMDERLTRLETSVPSSRPNDAPAATDEPAPQTSSSKPRLSSD